MTATIIRTKAEPEFKSVDGGGYSKLYVGDGDGSGYKIITRISDNGADPSSIYYNVSVSLYHGEEMLWNEHTGWVETLAEARKERTHLVKRARGFDV